MMLWDKATTSSLALSVLPQLPRPGWYQVPYEPKGQRREQRATNDTYPASVCGSRGTDVQLRVFRFRYRYRSREDGKDEGE